MIEHVMDLLVIFFLVACILLLAWGMLFKIPATNIEKAQLIEAAAGSEEAKAYVRDVLSRKNLQERHCRAAMGHIGWLVKKEQETQASQVVDAFLSNDAASK